MSGARRRKPKTNDKVLRPVHPNAGIRAAYRLQLEKLIEEMNASVQFWLKQSYKSNDPVIAQDELPANVLQRAIRKLGKRWQKRFDEAAPKLADYFAQSVDKRSAAALKKILRDGGFSVKFDATRTQNDVFTALVYENVSLIKSIPQKYLTDVEGSVMRSVQAGRDLGTLAKELERHYGVTKRRAAFIARDQNNKATAQLTRARQVDLGLTEAIWVHSGGGKTQRPTHVAASKRKQRYDVRKGMWDPDAHGKGKGDFVLPGTLPGCRCVSKTIVPGFE